MKEKFLAAAVLAAASTATILGAGPASADDVHQIYFAYNTDNGYVSGRLTGFSHDTYQVDARGGQVMIVEASPNWSDATVTVTGPTGTLSYQHQWTRVVLPVNGSYRLTISSPSHATIDYGMSVKID
ncbi:hypothetical protein ACWDUL_06365 [Nocardia niigatensis]|uniref:hypothetical protein n=1 Tax=Nocardia niigatensis TaxID=209249 RepID=UPI0002FBC665|nr:hypothetical protein [Nocardia niigatensis]